ncbi:MAG: GNAT family N-acetyltransferase [Bacilli bacterium]|nr:GNAT family N-acetyltransferase [Bacilli bacterium]
MIREAKEKDFEGILKIFIEVQTLHANNEPNIFRYAAPIDLCLFKSMINNQEIKIFVSEDKDKINGFLIGTIIKKDSNIKLPRKSFAIENIAVSKEEQNKNIGTKLMSTAKKFAKKEKCDSLVLNVWTFNKKAISFYKHLGFEEKSIQMELNL